MSLKRAGGGWTPGPGYLERVSDLEWVGPEDQGKRREHFEGSRHPSTGPSSSWFVHRCPVSGTTGEDGSRESFGVGPPDKRVGGTVRGNEGRRGGGGVDGVVSLRPSSDVHHHPERYRGVGLITDLS